MLNDLRALSAGGNVDGQMKLANAYFMGLGLPKDPHAAKRLYEEVLRAQSDAGGHAAYRLAVHYDQGLGGSPPEPKSARKL